MRYQTYKKTVNLANSEALANLEKLCDEKTGKVAAAELGITAPYLSDLKNGRRDLTDELLKKLLN